MRRIIHDAVDSELNNSFENLSGESSDSSDNTSNDTKSSPLPPMIVKAPISPTSGSTKFKYIKDLSPIDALINDCFKS